jgi:hypothetical protein
MGDRGVSGRGRWGDCVNRYVGLDHDMELAAEKRGQTQEFFGVGWGNQIPLFSAFFRVHQRPAV